MINPYPSGGVADMSILGSEIRDAQPGLQPDRQAAALLGSRRSLRAGARLRRVLADTTAT